MVSVSSFGKIYNTNIESDRSPTLYLEAYNKISFKMDFKPATRRRLKKNHILLHQKLFYFHLNICQIVVK